MTYYLSKGINCTPPGGGPLRVSHCGRVDILKNPLDELWLSGRFATCTVDAPAVKTKLEQLVRLGLAVASDEQENLAVYRILTNCVICPAKLKIIRTPLNKNERWLFHWIGNAGLRLTAAELVFLLDRGIEPLPQLLGKANRQSLTEAIYTTETIFDGLLEMKMEQVDKRDIATQGILGLLRKKRILLI